MASTNSVWGCFVGNGGCFLSNFNSAVRPYPPATNDEGFIALGWSKVGSMELYEANYKNFESQFFKVYPNEKPIQASEVFRFAFEAQIGDWVISPSAETGFLLVGEIISDYLSDFDGEFQFENYRHLRRVKWLWVIPKNDHRYTELNRIGQLTFSKSSRSIADVKTICDLPE